jgi:hypothetical protein
MPLHCAAPRGAAAPRPPHDRIKENKELKKVAAKGKREEEKERKRVEAQARLSGMTEAERAAHEERRKVRGGRGRAGRPATHARGKCARDSCMRGGRPPVAMRLLAGLPVSTQQE